MKIKSILVRTPSLKIEIIVINKIENTSFSYDIDYLSYIGLEKFSGFWRMGSKIFLPEEVLKLNVSYIDVNPVNTALQIFAIIT